MDRNKLWVTGAILVMVTIIAAGWFLGIQPQLTTAATANESRSTTQVQNASNEKLLASLKKDYSKIGTLKTQLASLQDSVPESAEISSFVTELDSLAASNNTILTAIRLNDAAAYTPPATAAPPTPAGNATPAPTPSATAVAPAPVAPVGTLQVTDPKITAANFVAIPVQLTVTGQYADLLDFVNGLQIGPRLFLVTSLSLATSPPATAKSTVPSVESNIGGFVYVLLQKDANGTNGAGPTSGASGASEASTK